MDAQDKKYLFLIFFMILIFRLPTFYQPVFDIDETFFAEFGKTILSGGIPYLDIVDNKSPLLLYFIALVFKITGQGNLIFVHIAMALIVMASAYFIFLCGKILKNSQAGLWAAFIFGVLAHVYEPKNISANIETLSNFFIPLTFLFYFFYLKNKTRRVLYAALTGLSVGFCMLCQWQAGILAVVLGTYSLLVESVFSGETHKLSRFFGELRFLLLAGLFAALPLFLTGLYFYRLGNLEAFLFWTLEYNFTYAEIGAEYVPVSQAFIRTALFLLSGLPVWVYLFFLMKKKAKENFSALKEKRLGLDEKVFFFLSLSIVIFFYIVFLGKRAYGHYFLILLSPVSLLAGFYVLSFPKRQLARILFLIFIGVGFTLPRLHLDTFYALIGNSFGKAEIEYRQVGEYLKSHASKSSKILVWGFATPIYYYADLKPATRFIAMDTLVGRLSIPDNMPVDPQEMLRKNPYSEKLWGLFYQDLGKNTPDFLIDVAPAGYYGYNRFAVQAYPKLSKYFENYQFVYQVNQIKIYQKK